MRKGLLATAVALLSTFILGTGTAAARSTTVTSFDGTQIHVNFFPADNPMAGDRSPTVLEGPGWGQPGDSNPESATDATVGAIGIGPLRAAGYNVLTWDPRGFGSSTGTVEVDSPDYEGRDVKRLISWVAQQPEAQLDGKNDPRIGMAGASYGGGVQLVTAAIDKRVDAIVPDIAWHSLTTSLYKDSTFKSGWGTILYTLGKAAGTLDPHIDSSFAAGSTTGRISAGDEQWFADRGPGDLVGKIKVPTLLIQGTVDTLFTLNEAVTNYRVLRHNGVPVHMLWFCGGHGGCLTDQGDTGLIEKRTLAWFDRYLAGKRGVRTGPGFEWLNQDGREFAAKHWLRGKMTLEARGQGSLPITQAGGSGPSKPGPGTVGAISGITNGTLAANAVNVKIAGRRTAKQVVGAPRLSLTYSGTGTEPDTRLFAQLVDDKTGTVLGNQVTPIPVTLDGKTHTVKRPLEMVAHTLRPGASVTLQVTASATNYGPQRSTGVAELKAVDVKLPVVSGARAEQPPTGA